MVSKGKVRYLKKLYPYYWSLAAWDRLNKAIQKMPRINYSKMIAEMPRLMTGETDGLYPIRRDVSPKELLGYPVTKSRYYKC